jgi:hypothetical protein
MIIKLTYYGTDRPTLVNMNNVESVYQVYDKGAKRFSTKICFSGNQSYINVDEDLQTIMRLSQDFTLGEFQDTEWVTPTLEQRLENSYRKTNNVNQYEYENNY